MYDIFYLQIKALFFGLYIVKILRAKHDLHGIINFRVYNVFFVYDDMNERHAQQTSLMYILERVPYCHQPVNECTRIYA